MSAIPAAGEVDLAAVGAVLAEPTRTHVLLALMDGRSLAASVLASEAGVAPSTASHHLGKLVDAGFVTVTSRGRHRYFALAGPRVGELIEAVSRVAPRQPITSLRQGTHAHAVRYARRCYDHLAGRLGVSLTDAFREHDLLAAPGSAFGGGDIDPRAAEFGGFSVTDLGVDAFADLGIATSPGEVVRGCLDWTEQRHHIAGPLGRALLNRLLELGWLVGSSKSRALRLTECGAESLEKHLGVDVPAP